MECATPAVIAVSSARLENRSPALRWPAYIALVAVALLAAALSLRGLAGAEPAFTDAARHVMNGALIHDMVRDGGYSNPVAYARGYYTRAPAISVPYHPPVFPVIEAAVFAVFGVGYDVARILSAFTVAAAVLLFGMLVLRTHRSPAVAALSAAAFVLLPFSQWVGHEVMLEFPSLLFIVGSCFAVADALANRRFTNATAFSFAVFAMLAFWTKQHSIFAAAVPFACIALLRRWTLLRDWRLWAASAAVGASVGAYLVLMRLAGAGSPTVWKYKPLHEVVIHHIDFYARALLKELGWIGVAAVVFTIGFHAARAVRGSFKERDALFAAWAICYGGFLLAITPWDTRYLFYLAPAMTVLLFSAVEQTAAALHAQRVWAIGCAVAIAVAAFVSWRPADRIEGFYTAARTVADMKPARVLICSKHNGAFTTGMRTEHERLESIILRGDAFPAEFFERVKFSAFLHEYGIDAVVIHDTPAMDRWEAVRNAAMPQLQLQRTIPIAAQNMPGGSILIYRHTNPSPTPANALRIGSTMVGGGLNVELD